MTNERNIDDYPEYMRPFIAAGYKPFDYAEYAKSPLS